jgi:DNA-binding NtrC family response regulator
MPRALLIVDDHEGVLRGLARIFTRDGHRVISAADIPGALASLREPVDVILSDYDLPHGTGLIVLEKARDIQPSALRILMSAVPLAHALAVRFSGVVETALAKPFTMLEFEEARQRVLRFRGIR